MKYCFWLLILGIALGVSGCSINPEDKAFFERGWVHPSDLDTH